jgi:glyoxylase-like metal-dependent hydrolase (beta-lactamase superfamily II)
MIWLVGGADEDVRTDEHDCHMYLVHDGSSGVLVDAGTGLGSERWLQNIGLVCEPSALSGVLLTHYHADHAGGAAAASSAGLRLFASATTADALLGADEERTSLARARAVGVYPPDYSLSPAHIDVRLEDGDSLDTGGLRLTVIDAPGHCDGHIVFLFDGPSGRVLFSGDSVFSGGRVSIQALPDCRLDRYAETLMTFAGLDVDVLLAGHGDPVLHDARADLGRAADSFRRLVPPPNFLT